MTRQRVVLVAAALLIALPMTTLAACGKSSNTGAPRSGDCDSMPFVRLDMQTYPTVEKEFGFSVDYVVRLAARLDIVRQALDFEPRDMTVSIKSVPDDGSSLEFKEEGLNAATIDERFELPAGDYVVTGDNYTSIELFRCVE